MHQTLMDLWFGFGVALQPTHLMWSVFGVLMGNLIGVLPGMGALTTISILLPLTYFIAPVPAILMLAGIFYGSQYGGAIGAILLNLPSHPPHAVTCIDGYPLTRMGKGGSALGIAMLSSFVAASAGILMMIFLSPLLVRVAFKFGAPEIASIMILGLVAGSTMSRGSPLKGMAMTCFGLLCGCVGTDLSTGMFRFTFGLSGLSDGVELGALCMGVFGIADFVLQANRATAPLPSAKVRMRDMRPSREELRQSFWPMLRGTLVGLLFGAMPGTGPTITTFIAYAVERRVAKDPSRFGKGAIEGVAAPEAASHSKTQVDFIPTMTLGIPGDAVMALILGALILKGIQPGPLLITEHADIFWGLVASFWIGNAILMVLNIPLIGVWVKLLRVPYRLMFPAAVFFICIGVYSVRNELFDVGVVAVFGALGALFMSLDFPVAPIILGFVLGPMLEENFRRALLLSYGHLDVFVRHPISAVVLGIAGVILLVQVSSSVRASLRGRHRMARRVQRPA
ncbi:tripartite tricarboxylate transporter permease [Thiomonas sp. FB-6]|uniref:tripartite tricarboxylate transporter permease n=1 Tax=Thiomonas sp. FB-6 TaxID=1158291 RepID=UPI0003803442|nr:tripartite tricarboxylate transporter permease [Thiomonas sp. FB-6]